MKKTRTKTCTVRDSRELRHVSAPVVRIAQINEPTLGTDEETTTKVKATAFVRKGQNLFKSSAMLLSLLIFKK